MLLHQAMITRIFFIQNSHCVLHALCFFRRKTDTTIMKYKDIATGYVSPPYRSSTSTKIILFTITTTKSLFVKQSHIIECLSTDVHTKPNARRHINLTSRQLCKYRIHLGDSFFSKQWVGLTVTRETTNFCIIRKRRDGGDSFVFRSMRQHSI